MNVNGANKGMWHTAGVPLRREGDAPPRSTTLDSRLRRPLRNFSWRARLWKGRETPPAWDPTLDSRLRGNDGRGGCGTLCRCSGEGQDDAAL